MRDFHVFIEQQGEQIYVGKITGSGSEDAVFLYGRSSRTGERTHEDKRYIYHTRQRWRAGTD